jgi:hypothetical protein
MALLLLLPMLLPMIFRDIIIDGGGVVVFDDDDDGGYLKNGVVVVLGHETHAVSVRFVFEAFYVALGVFKEPQGRFVEIVGEVSRQIVVALIETQKQMLVVERGEMDDGVAADVERFFQIDLGNVLVAQTRQTIDVETQTARHVDRWGNVHQAL